MLLQIIKTWLTIRFDIDGVGGIEGIEKLKDVVYYITICILISEHPRL